MFVLQLLIVVTIDWGQKLLWHVVFLSCVACSNKTIPDSVDFLVVVELIIIVFGLIERISSFSAVMTKIFF